MSDFTPLVATEVFRTNFDAVVAPSGGDYTVIQDADDALDAGPYTLIVRPGTYAGFTVTTNNVFIFLAPGVVITSAVLLSGDNISLIHGPGCDIQALITASGLNAHVEFLNACSLVGVLMSGNLGYLNGGGWDTLSNGGVAVDGIQVTGEDVVVENISVQTTAGGGNALDGVSLEGVRPTLKKVRVVDSDDVGISIALAAVDALIEGCVDLGADGNGIDVLGPRARIIGNYVFESGGNGIGIGATGDNSGVEGNIVQDQVGNSVDIDALGEDCVVVANRLDGAVSDASGTSTVADNDTTAF